MKFSMHTKIQLKSSALACAVLLLGMTQSCFAQDASASLSKPYVTVNGQAQSNALAEILLREQLARGANDSAELRQAIREALINQALMTQEARKAKLDANPLLQAQTELAQQNILAQAWQQKVLADAPPKEEDLKAEYDRQIARMSDKDFLIRHLLVAQEATAKLLLEKIQAGAKIADLAKEYSQDPQSRERGGLTDWVNAADLSPALAESVKTIAKGKLAAKPIKSDAGWHVVQVEDTRPFKAPSFAETKPQLAGIVARLALDARLKTLRQQAKIQ
jgi:peptidyl-prolyl cis-trans isomerase C